MTFKTPEQGKCTAGSWKAGPFSSVVGCPITAQPDRGRDAIVVAGVHGSAAEDRAGHRAEVEANAWMIAASKDLYAAAFEAERALVEAFGDVPYLRNVVNERESDPIRSQAWDAILSIRKARAKAEGRS